MYNELHNEHFRKRGFVVVAVLALFGIGALLYNSGWSQGFALGVLTGGADGTELARYFAYRAGPGMLHGGFGFFGFVFRIGFLLLALAFFAKLFGFLRWRMHGGQGPWSHEHWHHGPWGEQPQPPQQPQQSQQQPQQPPVQSGPAGSPNQPGEGGPQPVSWINV